MPLLTVPSTEALGLALEVLKLVAMVAAFFYLRLLAAQRRTDDAHDEHERKMDDRLDGFERHLVRLDERVAHMPDSDSVGRIHQRLDELTIQIARNEGRQETITELTKAMNSMFMRAGERSA